MSDINNLKTQGQKTLTEIFSYIDNVTMDDLKSEGITLRSGNKIIKFEVVSETVNSYEDEIREEIRQKLKEKMAHVKENINNRIDNIMSMSKKIQNEAKRKVEELKDKIANSQPMPDVNITHAERGLSVVKGPDNTMVWLVRGVYWPKYAVPFEDSEIKQIEPKYSKKMTSEIIFMIKTEGKYIKEVTTKTPVGLEKFEHYHQRLLRGSTDCWGTWKYATTWSTPDDIIKIAKEAEAVLETVYFPSIATDNPKFLPQKVNLLEHLLNEPVNTGRLNTTLLRLGIRSNRNNESVWSA